MTFARIATLATSLSAVAMSGCATGSRPAAPPPNYSLIAGRAVSQAGELYVGCLKAAIADRSYDMTTGEGANLLRFTCTGEPARRLYDGLAKRSASQHSEWVNEGRTWRSTQRVAKNLVGTDYCSTGSATDFRCDLTMNVGEFLTTTLN